MQNRWKLIITISIIFGLSIAVVLPLYYFDILLPKKHNIYDYVYPNPLWFASTLSDLVAENDSSVHFCMTNFSNILEDVDNIIYLRLDFDDEKVFSLPLIENSLSATFFQIKIGLDPVNKPFIYIYDYNGYLYQEGNIFTIINDTWEFHPALNNVPYHCNELSRSAVLNWAFSETGKLMLAFIYQHPYAKPADLTLPYVVTPVVYNGTTNQGLFLHEIFPEIETHFSCAPGDFKIMNSNVAIMWERYAGPEYVRPYLAINWSKEGWQLYKLGDGYPPRYPIAIIPTNGIFNVFYHESGYVNNISGLFVTQVINSSYLIAKQIMSTYGNLFFNYDSISLLDDNTFLFIYSRRPTLVRDSQIELYLGRYDGEKFEEVRLTNTPDYSEIDAHCDISENYFHYAWSSFYEKAKTESSWGPAKIYYNRIPLDEIDNIFSEGVSHLSLNIDKIHSEKNRTIISSSMMVLTLVSKKIELMLALYLSKIESENNAIS